MSFPPTLLGQNHWKKAMQFGFKNAVLAKWGAAIVFFLAGPCSADLISYWSLDGNTIDSADFGQSRDDGVFSGKERYGEGKLGKAIVLDGSNYVAIDTSEDLEVAGESLSVAVWLRVDAWNSSWQTLLSKGERDSFRIARRADDDDMLAFEGGYSEGGVREEAVGGKVGDGKWHQVIAVAGGGARKMLYVDGDLVDTSVETRLGDSGAPFYLGGNPLVSGREWVGAIDDVGIFSRVLTPLEVKAIWTWGDDPRFRYDLKSASKLIRLHQTRSLEVLSIGGDQWKYVASDPRDDSAFVELGENGSGVTNSKIPAVLEFETSKRFIHSGESVMLRWRVSGDATKVSIDGVDFANEIDSPNDFKVTPERSTAYRLSAKNRHGSVSANVMVHVDYAFSSPEISEFMSDSAAEHPDEDLDPSDWIEIHNPGPNTAKLSDCFLTDDPDELTKWNFPDIYLEKDQYLVVHASGKDRRGAISSLHTNFKLAKNGEYLALTQRDGADVKVVSNAGKTYPVQSRGVSFGRSSDGVLGVLAEPTPGYVNAEVVTGTVGDVWFGTVRSLCKDPFSLELGCRTPGATIRYTTDGTSPTLDSGQLYRSPLEIDTTTVIRAAAFKEKMRHSSVSTHTFIFPADVLRQPNAPAGFPGSWGAVEADYQMDPRITEAAAYKRDIEKGLLALPSVAIALPSGDLFDREKGIYSNSMKSGREWERAASMELIYPDGDEGVQIPCGLRAQGGYSRHPEFLKHSLRVLFKRQYGATKLEYPIFPSQDAVTSFDSLTLRACFNYTWHRGFEKEEVQAQYLRDEFMRRSQLAMGQPSSHGIFVHLYLNGLYWGIYNLVERPNADFASSYLSGKKKDFDVLNSGKAIDGTNETWRTVLRLASETDSDRMYSTLSSYVDFYNLIDYMLLNYYGGNVDWDYHNWYAARRRKNDAGFHFFSWDAEQTLTNALSENVVGTHYPNSPTYVFRRLLRNKAFQSLVARRIQLHFFRDGALTAHRSGERYATLSKEIEDAIVAESARWGDSQNSDPYTRDDFWIPERDRLLNSFFPDRTDAVLEQIQSAGTFSYVIPPEVEQMGESVKISTVAGRLFYTTDGKDPKRSDGSIESTAKRTRESGGDELLFSRGSKWRYLDDGSEPLNAWKEASFDDSDWKIGKARLGYGGDGEVTKLGFGGNSRSKFVTSYFRRKVVLKTTNIDSIRLRLIRDDGAIVYINGKEILRNNMPGNGEITASTFAIASINGDDEKNPLVYSIPVEVFEEGANTIAVEVHQCNASSSDLGFDLELVGRRSIGVSIPQPSKGRIIARTFYQGRWSSPVFVRQF